MSIDISEGFLNLSMNLMQKKNDISSLKEYLENPCNNESEDVARLLMIASTDVSSVSPTTIIAVTLNEKEFEDIPSLFIKSYLNEDDSFEKDYEKTLNEKYWSLEEMPEEKVYNKITEYYKEKLLKKNIDVRLIEPLTELFESMSSRNKGSVKNGNKERH